jgi:hypothetical protein
MSAQHTPQPLWSAKDSRAVLAEAGKQIWLSMRNWGDPLGNVVRTHCYRRKSWVDVNDKHILRAPGRAKAAPNGEQP